MREVRSANGLAVETFRQRLRDRRVVVWGGNGACVEVVAALAGRYGVAEGDVLCMQPIGFDAFPGFAARSPDAFFSTVPLDPARHFVIVASVGFRRQILARLEATGAKAGQDFLGERELFRQRMVLRLLPGEAIDIDAVAGFLEREHAGLSGATLEIGGLPDPLESPGLEALFDRLAGLFPLTLSSFVPRRDLADLVRRHAMRLRLVAYGDRGLFSRHFPARAAPDWADVVALANRIGADRPIELVRIGFPAEQAAPLPRPGNLIVSTDISYPNDFSPLLRLAEAPDPRAFAAAQSVCGFDLSDILAKAKAQKDRACMCERVYPVFRGDGAIALCHLHFDGTLAADARQAGLSDIVGRRAFHDYCRRCQAQGIHRLDLGLLDRDLLA